MSRIHILLALAIVPAAIAADLDVRAQVRSDVAELIRTHNPRLAADREKFLTAIDEALRSCEEEAPGILASAPESAVPSKDAIAKTLQACGELPRSEFWLFYVQRFEADRLTSAQKVIFHRSLIARIDAAAAERRKRESKNG